MTRAGLSRVWHTIIALVCFSSVTAQVTRVFAVTRGHRSETAIRLVRFFSFFTIQSNLLVLITAGLLVARPNRDGPLWRVARVAALVGITVTLVVYFVALRPLETLHGIPRLANIGVHYVAPLMTIGGWLLFGPRAQLDRTSLLRHLTWPVAYLAYVLAFGAVTGWYPYPFFNAARIGYGRTLLAALIITALLLAVGAVYHLLDRKLSGPTSPENEKPLS